MGRAITERVGPEFSKSGKVVDRGGCVAKHLISNPRGFTSEIDVLKFSAPIEHVVGDGGDAARDRQADQAGAFRKRATVYGDNAVWNRYQSQAKGELKRVLCEGCNGKTSEFICDG